MKSCCEKNSILRECIEAMCQNHEEVLDFLISLKAQDLDIDPFTLDLMIDRMEDIEYRNDLKLPDNFYCECNEKKK